jgi:hypothetical protein
MNIRKLLTLATAGTAAASISIFGLGLTPAYAIDNPVTFEVLTGSLTLAQTPASTLLVEGSAQDMPVTTVTDGRSAADRTGAWTVSASASDLFAANGVGTGDDATILASQITIDETAGSFTAGSGTPAHPAAVVGATPAALVSATADTIDSVYSYTPTALLADQTLPFAGSYTGNVTQTVV